jgi:integrase
MARRRTGSIEKRGNLYWARHTINTQGVTIRRWFALGTASLAVARAKNDRLLEQIARGEIPDADALAVPETCAQAFERIVGEMRGEGLKSWKDRLYRLQAYAVPVLGEVEIGAANAGHVRDALEECRGAGKSKQTITHLRNDLHAVFDALWRADAVKENPVAKVRAPKFATEDERPRQLLTDEEFVRFMSCADVTLILRVMALASRVFGGMRTSDLHAWRWEHIDTVGWTTAKIRRPKVRGLTLIEMPQTLLPWLKFWWTETGSRRTGPVFPVGRGERADEHRKHTGYASALRTALRRAFGIDAQTDEARANKHDRRQHWVQVRELTERERLLLEDNDETRRLDFHSFRRAYVTALADSGVNAQQAMKLAAHTKIETHLRYVDRTRALKTPEGIAPDVGQLPILVRGTPTTNPEQSHCLEGAAE